MADEKTKRFREHVVRELYVTERDYAKNLRFIVTVGLPTLAELVIKPL